MKYVFRRYEEYSFVSEYITWEDDCADCLLLPVVFLLIGKQLVACWPMNTTPRMSQQNIGLYY